MSRIRVLALVSVLTVTPITMLSLTAQADEASAEGAAVTETIELTSGDKITGVIVSRDESGVVMDHPVFGRITIPDAEIAVETPEPETPGLFGTNFLRGATRSVGLGVSGASGNTQNVGLSVTLAIEKETDRHRGRFGTAYLYSSDSGAQTQNQFFVRYLHDLLFPKTKFFLYGNTRFDYDEFRDWDERIAAALGAGYGIYEDQRFDLVGRLGFGFSKNFGSTLSSDDDVVPEMQVGIEFGWTIIDGLTFKVGNVYMPNLGDISAFRNITDAVYRIDIGIVRGLSFNFGIENEYISNSPTKKNDLKYIGSLSYDL